MPRRWIGSMREQLTLQQDAWPSLVVSSLTSAGTTATATTAAAHGYQTGDLVTVSGATPAGYNGKVKVTVTGATTFTYTVAAGLTSPATGSVRVTFTADAQGGRRANWVTVATVYAEQLPLRAAETLQAQTIGAVHVHRFRIRRRADVGPSWRARWTPTFPADAAEQTLEIHGVLESTDVGYAVLEASVRR